MQVRSSVPHSSPDQSTEKSLGAIASTAIYNLGWRLTHQPLGVEATMTLAELEHTFFFTCAGYPGEHAASIDSQTGRMWFLSKGIQADLLPRPDDELVGQLRQVQRTHEPVGGLKREGERLFNGDHDQFCVPPRGRG